MDNLDRRSALVLGVAVAAPVFALPRPAAAAMYGPDDGKEVAPGIREVDLGEWPVSFATYKKAQVSDFVFAPGSGFPNEAMKNDMVCHMVRR